MSVLYRTDIPYTIRPARSTDCRFVYDLSQDPRIRMASTRSEEFSYEEHQRWWYTKRGNRLNAIWIMEIGVPVGQVRYGKSDILAAEVAISVKLIHVEGRRVTFEASVADGADAVAHGTHERFIVDVQKVRERLLKKKAQRG